MVLLSIIIATVFISLFSLIGIVSIFFSQKRREEILLALVNFATGALIGGAFFHLLPESFELSSYTPYYLVAGVFLFLVLEKFLYWRHCHKGEKCEIHNRYFSYLNLIGDGFHNLIDGIVVAGAFLTDSRLGIVTALAVAIHEIPQELGDFGILLYGGFSIKKALYFNLLSGLTAVLGGIATYFLGSGVETVKPVFLSLAAGGFLYIALVDLLPEMRQRNSLRESATQILLLLLGLGLMWLLKVTLLV